MPTITITRTPVLTKTRVERRLIDEIAAMNIPLMATQLHARNPFIAMFAYRCSLTDLLLPESGGLASARANAQARVDEVIGLLPMRHATSASMRGSILLSRA